MARVPDVRAWCLITGGALLGVAGAHALELYVATDGADVWGMAYFATGARARDVPVSFVVDDAPVVVVRTDAEGRFRFVAPPPVASRVEAETLDGHRAVWDLPVDAWTGVTATEAEREAVATGVAAAAGPSAASVLVGLGTLLGLSVWARLAWPKKRG